MALKYTITETDVAKWGQLGILFFIKRLEKGVRLDSLKRETWAEAAEIGADPETLMKAKISVIIRLTTAFDSNVLMDTNNPPEILYRNRDLLLSHLAHTLAKSNVSLHPRERKQVVEEAKRVGIDPDTLIDFHLFLFSRAFEAATRAEIEITSN